MPEFSLPMLEYMDKLIHTNIYKYTDIHITFTYTYLLNFGHIYLLSIVNLWM